MSVTERFVSNFNSLTGTTLGERRKNLFLLLNQTKKSLENGSEIDFSSLHPKTPLEETFKVEVLLYFQKIPDLLDVLKSENPVLIKKVLKGKPWLLGQAFASFTDEQLVTLIFPYVSFNVKVKIVNKLAVCLSDPQQSDLFFEAIRKKYGLYLALQLLPSCSANLILKFISKCGRKLQPRQLLIIVKKHPELVETIFEQLNSTMSKCSIASIHRSTFLYLAKTNDKKFLKLYEKYNPSLHLGWRASNKFICANKETIISKAYKLFSLLHKKQCYKSLKQDFKEFYFRLYPVGIERFSNSFSFLYSFIIKLTLDTQKLCLLEDAFKRKYGTELWEHPECITVTMLDLAPLEKRQNIKFKPPHISDDRWVMYISTDQAIPLLKKRISLTSDIKTRATLLTFLVETCKINKDTTALIGVCKYILAQHCNDHCSVRIRFLVALKHSFKLEELTEEHWLYINELIQIFDINNESFNDAAHFLLGYIHYRLLQKLPIEQFLTEYLKIKCNGMNLFRNNPDFEKQCLLLIGELLPQIFEGESLKYRNLNFLIALIDWNERHPEDHIAVVNYSDAFESFKLVLKQHECISQIQPIIIYCLKYQSEEVTAYLTTACLQKLSINFKNRKILNWLLKYKTLTMMHYTEAITKLALQCPNHYFWRFCRNYFHLEIPQKVIAVCLDVLNSEAKDKEKRNAVTVLSYLMTTEQFLHMFADYYPTDLKIDTRSVESRRRYKYQIAIATSLKNIIPPSLALKPILQFCKGDYLKLIQSSLYSVCGNINENVLPQFFSELAGQAVSIRKHAFHLTLRVLDRALIFDVFGKFMETERNASIRKFLLKGSFRLFLQDPDDYLWKLVKCNVEMVNVDDNEAVNILKQIDKVPLEYSAEYVPFVWTFFEKSPYGDTHKFQLLHSLSPSVIQILPKEFCCSIIDKYVLRFVDAGVKSFEFTVHSFTCKFIIYCKSQSEQEDYMNMVFPVLRDWMGSVHLRYIADKFLKTFCSEFRRQNCLSKTILSTFTTRWNSYIEPHKAFDQYLYLQFCLLYLDKINERLTLHQIGEKLSHLSNSLSDSYGLAVVHVFCDVLESFIVDFVNGKGEDEYNNDCYNIVEAMIKTSSSSACLVSAISLLKPHIGDKDQIRVRHVKIIKMLNDVPDPIIQIYLNHHLDDW